MRRLVLLCVQPQTKSSGEAADSIDAILAELASIDRLFLVDDVHCGAARGGVGGGHVALVLPGLGTGTSGGGGGGGSGSSNLGRQKQSTTSDGSGSGGRNGSSNSNTGCWLEPAEARRAAQDMRFRLASTTVRTRASAPTQPPQTQPSVVVRRTSPRKPRSNGRATTAGNGRSSNSSSSSSSSSSKGGRGGRASGRGGGDGVEIGGGSSGSGGGGDGDGLLPSKSQMIAAACMEAASALHTLADSLELCDDDPLALVLDVVWVGQRPKLSVGARSTLGPSVAALYCALSRLQTRGSACCHVVAPYDAEWAHILSAPATTAYTFGKCANDSLLAGIVHRDATASAAAASAATGSDLLLRRVPLCLQGTSEGMAEACRLLVRSAKVEAAALSGPRASRTEAHGAATSVVHGASSVVPCPRAWLPVGTRLLLLHICRLSTVPGFLLGPTVLEVEAEATVVLLPNGAEAAAAAAATAEAATAGTETATAAVTACSILSALMADDASAQDSCLVLQAVRPTETGRTSISWFRSLKRQLAAPSVNTHGHCYLLYTRQGRLVLQRFRDRIDSGFAALLIDSSSCSIGNTSGEGVAAIGAATTGESGGGGGGEGEGGGAKGAVAKNEEEPHEAIDDPSIAPVASSAEVPSTVDVETAAWLASLPTYTLSSVLHNEAMFASQAAHIVATAKLSNEKGETIGEKTTKAAQAVTATVGPVSLLSNIDNARRNLVYTSQDMTSSSAVAHSPSSTSSLTRIGPTVASAESSLAVGHVSAGAGAGAAAAAVAAATTTTAGATTTTAGAAASNIIPTKNSVAVPRRRGRRRLLMRSPQSVRNSKSTAAVVPTSSNVQPMSTYGGGTTRTTSITTTTSTYDGVGKPKLRSGGAPTPVTPSSSLAALDARASTVRRRSMAREERLDDISSLFETSDTTAGSSSNAAVISDFEWLRRTVEFCALPSVAAGNGGGQRGGRRKRRSAASSAELALMSTASSSRGKIRRTGSGSVIRYGSISVEALQNHFDSSGRARVTTSGEATSSAITAASTGPFTRVSSSEFLRHSSGGHSLYSSSPPSSSSGGHLPMSVSNGGSGGGQGWREARHHWRSQPFEAVAKIREKGIDYCTESSLRRAARGQRIAEREVRNSAASALVRSGSGDHAGDTSFAHASASAPPPPDVGSGSRSRSGGAGRATRSSSAPARIAPTQLERPFVMESAQGASGDGSGGSSMVSKDDLKQILKRAVKEELKAFELDAKALKRAYETAFAVCKVFLRHAGPLTSEAARTRSVELARKNVPEAVHNLR